MHAAAAALESKYKHAHMLAVLQTSSYKTHSCSSAGAPLTVKTASNYISWHELLLADSRMHSNMLCQQP
jgi:hypothetical protein